MTTAVMESFGNQRLAAPQAARKRAMVGRFAVRAGSVSDDLGLRMTPSAFMSKIIVRKLVPK
jgi:hypothetical protein